MSNPFLGRTPSLSGPAHDIRPVTPDDAVVFEDTAIGLYIETAGMVHFETVAGELRRVAVNALSILPVGARRVMATGTTASGIHALVIS